MAEAEHLARYFQLLSDAGCEVLVVDGSPADVFTQHGDAWKRNCRHERVDPRFGYLNDKVNGIHTGVERARFEKIVLADDDVRYDAESLSAVLRLLDHFAVVRPQNFLEPLPWWACLEAARMLINRAVLPAADYPGTCAFRRGTMLEAGHYDGDVLFDNEEIIRHFASRGVTISYANDLFVRKRPPLFRKWLEQRVRQAYEDFGMRAKTALFAAILPALVLIFILCSWTGFALAFSGVALASIFLAWSGRRIGNAARYFPLRCCCFAPLWVLERAFSTYGAFYFHLVRGGYPFGGRILSKGIGRDWWKGARPTATSLAERQKG